jgi:protein SCO1/2
MTPSTPQQDKPKRNEKKPLPLSLIVGVFIGSMLISGIVVYAVLSSVIDTSPPDVYEARQPDGARIIDPPRAVDDFTLMADSGDPLSLSDLQGQPVLMYFGYTYCPDVCLITLSDVRRVRHLLGDEADALHYVFISVDGERDTPQRLRQFFDSYDNTDFMIGMQGDEEVLNSIKTDYSLVWELHTDEADEYGNYIVDHSSRLYLLDANGDLAYTFAYGTQADTITGYIQALLNGDSSLDA